MSLYVIGDLYFLILVNKLMNIFGSNWDGYEKKIIDNWKEVVEEEDMVLVLGDIFWGINLFEVKKDLDIISKFLGQKIFIKGNYDYWWIIVISLNKLYEDMCFIQINFYEYKDYVICGGRGWICFNDVKFDEIDEKVYKREEYRFRLLLEFVCKSGYLKIIVIIYYFFMNDKLEEFLFIKLFEEYNVEKVIYGYLYGKEFFKMGLKGI